ncbi:MAG: hypothetical protein AAFP87_20445 [Pseudomonadota bacterium]
MTGEHELLERFGALIMEVADALDDEGDRVFLGTTNHADALRNARDEWFEKRFLADE